MLSLAETLYSNYQVSVFEFEALASLEMTGINDRNTILARCTSAKLSAIPKMCTISRGVGGDTLMYRNDSTPEFASQINNFRCCGL